MHREDKSTTTTPLFLFLLPFFWCLNYQTLFFSIELYIFSPYFSLSSCQSKLFLSSFHAVQSALSLSRHTQSFSLLSWKQELTKNLPEGSKHYNRSIPRRARELQKDLICSRNNTQALCKFVFLVIWLCECLHNAHFVILFMFCPSYFLNLDMMWCHLIFPLDLFF